MTRKFLDTLKTEMSGVGRIEDNTTGLVSPADVRAVLTDIIDSTVQDEASLKSTAAFTGYSMPATYAVIGGSGVYDAETGDDGDFLNNDLTAGTITGTSVAGYSYVVDASITLSNVANGRPIILAITSDDVVTDETSVVGAGADPISRSWRRFIQTASADETFAIAAYDDSGASTCDINSINLTVSIVPTRNNA